jgi:hypothetical protein
VAMNGDGPRAVFSPQVWLMIVLAVASAAFFVGTMTTSGDKYVSRSEYTAAVTTLHESITDLKASILSLDLLVRQNVVPEKKR